MSVSTATPRQIAGRIASTHNSGECFACKRPVDSGVFAFGLSGSDARWYPDRDTAERANANRARYLLDVDADREITIDETLAYLERQRDEIEHLVEHLEAERAERRAVREMRDIGIIAAAYPCDDCGHPKRRPADRCDRCGDEPCSLALDPHEYNRARGYID
jgi:hypothetical protein